MINTANEIPTGKYRDRLVVLIKIVVTAVLVIYLYRSVRPIEIVEALKQANIYFVIAALFLVLPNLYLQFYKWKIICNKTLDETSNKKIMYSLFYGLSGGIATPFRIGEYVGRSIVFKEKGILAVTVATLIDKVFVLIVIVLAGSITGILFLQVYYGTGMLLAVTAYILIVLVTCLIFLFVSKENLFNSLLKILPGIKSLHDFLGSLRSLKGLGRRAAYTVAITTLVLCATYISQFAILTAAYSNQADMIKYLWAGVMVMFVKSVFPPVTFGELGVREGASVFFLTKMGVSSAVALDTSLTLFAFNMLLPSLAGLLMILIKKD